MTETSGGEYAATKSSFEGDGAEKETVTYPSSSTLVGVTEMETLASGCTVIARELIKLSACGSLCANTVDKHNESNSKQPQ